MIFHCDQNTHARTQMDRRTMQSGRRSLGEVINIPLSPLIVTVSPRIRPGIICAQHTSDRRELMVE